jgi:hypothetical protein
MHGFFRTLAASLFLVMPGNADELLSTLTVESLDRTQELLTSVLPTHPVLLIAGFTRSSRSQTRAWSQRFGLSGTAGLQPPGGLAGQQRPGSFELCCACRSH